MQSNATSRTRVTHRLAAGALWIAASALTVLGACSSQPSAGTPGGAVGGSLAASAVDTPSGAVGGSLAAVDTPSGAVGGSLAAVDTPNGTVGGSLAASAIETPVKKEGNYHSEVQLSPPHPAAGQDAVLHVAIQDASGRAITELDPSHERPLHMMIISGDLASFAHVHPVPDGPRFRVEHRFERGGEYLLIVDYRQPGGGQATDKHRVHVRGATLDPMPLLESPRRRRSDGLELTLRSERELRAGETATLHFDAMDLETGMPAMDLEPYLGSKAHFVVLSAGGEDFVHVHASDAGPPSRVSAEAVFPRPGLYKLWAQLQRRGKVVTIPFVIRLGSARVESDSNAAANSNDHHPRHAH